MGAGKSTVGLEVARLAERPFLDTDAEIEKRHGPIWRIFEERGEADFRRLEEAVVAEAVSAPDPAVVALGGGAVLSERTRDRLRAAFTVWIEVGVDDAWSRAQGADRPLARDEESFRRLFAEREPLYANLSDATASDAEGVLLSALRVTIGREAVAGDAAVADERVAELHPPPVDGPVHTVPAGEAAKRLDVAARLWKKLEIGREGALVAFGGGSTTDLAGFVAATYLRGIRWIAIPTTLVGQVDAAIGGKTSIDLAKGKNLVGAFHYPEAVILDADYLATLPEREQQNGMAEVVKTGLLTGEPLWQLAEKEMIRRCAAFKAAVCLSDPFETTGRRAILNLGHTFAHGLEAASGYELAHGNAVALGLLAALRLSGQPTEVVEEVLRPEPVPVDSDAAWAAMRRDKKGEGVFVLLEAPGRPAVKTVPEADARRALETLIAK